VINIFHADSDKGQSTTDLNGQFVFSQLLIDVLLRIVPNPTDSSQLISFCERVYEGNSTGLSHIKQFKGNYTSERALFWFTRDLFFYRMLNQALRRQSIDILFLFRSYIQDIYENLKTNQCQSSIKVYRGQWMSNDEFNNLRQAVGQFISFNSFLSTSKQRPLAQIYTDKSSDELQGVLFEIDADPGMKSIKPFADISSYSNFNEECEVLFMLGSIFHIVDICFDDEQIWLVRMKLCGDDKHDSKSIIEYIQNQYEKDETHLGSLGIILANMGRLKEADKYYTCLLDELPSNNPLRVGLYCNLGLLADRKGEYDTSLKWYRKSLKLAMKICPFDSLNIVNMHNCIGLIYQEKGYFNRALKTYRTAVSTFKRAQIKSHPYIASVYSNIGIVYQSKEKFSKALSFYKKSLALRKKYLPRNHPNIGGSYNNIGSIYYSLAKLDLALKYFNRSLEIRLKSLPSQHEDVALSYANIGLVYEDKDDLKQALTYFQKATDIIRNILPSDHPDAIRIENDFRRLSSISECPR
jgi:tetratricopeptide (TPR) repeat protein